MKGLLTTLPNLYNIQCSNPKKNPYIDALYGVYLFFLNNPLKVDILKNKAVDMGIQTSDLFQSVHKSELSSM